MKMFSWWSSEFGSGNQNHYRNVGSNSHNDCDSYRVNGGKFRSNRRSFEVILGARIEINNHLSIHLLEIQVDVKVGIPRSRLRLFSIV